MIVWWVTYSPANFSDPLWCGLEFGYEETSLRAEGQLSGGTLNGNTRRTIEVKINA